MKIDRNWRVLLICGTALCAVTAVVILVKTASLCPSDVGGETNEELRFIDDESNTEFNFRGTVPMGFGDALDAPRPLGLAAALLVVGC